MIFLKKVYYVLIVINIIILFAGLRKTVPLYYIFLVLLPLALVTQVFGDFAKLYNFNRYTFFHTYIIVEFVLLSIYYYQLLKSKRSKNFVLLSVFLFLAIISVNYARVPQAFFSSGFLDFVLVAVFITIFTTQYFIDEIKDENEVSFHTKPSFWINIGNLFFYTGCLLVMGFNNYLENHYPSLSQKLLYINYCLNLLLYSLYLKGFVCILKVTKY